MLESLNNVLLDSEQIYLLYSNKIDIKAFAMNCRIEEEDAKEIQKTLQGDHIRIVSTDQMAQKYNKDDIDPILDDLDAYVDLGVRYGSEIGATPEEKKERQKIEDEMAEEEGKEPEDHDNEVDDSDFVKRVNSDFIGVSTDGIEEYFWKKSGTQGYLYFILDPTPEVLKLIKKL